jgi:hypothetical protein
VRPAEVLAIVARKQPIARAGIVCKTAENEQLFRRTLYTQKRSHSYSRFDTAELTARILRRCPAVPV